MKVLIIGAGGGLGSRIAKACVNRNHQVTLFVRSKERLEKALPDVSTKTTIIEGSATSVSDLKKAMLGQDAVVNAAGVTGFEKKQLRQSDLPEIVKAVVDAAVLTIPGKRLWILAGLAVLDMPGTNGRNMTEWFPFFPEHITNWHYLQETAGALDWSMLAPALMTPGKEEGKTEYAVDVPPGWSVSTLPVVGRYWSLATNMSRYNISFEDAGAFVADHLGPGGDMSGKRVGLRYQSK